MGAVPFSVLPAAAWTLRKRALAGHRGTARTGQPKSPSGVHHTAAPGRVPGGCASSPRSVTPTGARPGARRGRACAGCRRGGKGGSARASGGRLHTWLPTRGFGKGSRRETPTADHALLPEAQAKLSAFKSYTVTHPLLEKTETALIQALREPAGFAHVLLYGPTGAGKTTVLTHATARLSSFFLSQRTLAQGSAPFLGVRALYQPEARSPSPLLLLEARIPDGGTFNRADYYRTALVKLGESFYGEYRVMDINEGQTWETKTRARGRAAQFSDSEQLRHALEDAVARRGVRAIIIDEAQHLMKVASGVKLLDQLEWLKSMSNTMGVVHVLVGTYDLLDLRNLSSQAARRGHDIHFPRYQFQQEADQIAFQRTLRGLLEHVPLQMDLQDLMNHWYYFYERSIGCIGVLKDWLVRTLSDALHSGADTFMLDRLQAHALSNAQRERMATDAAAAEHRLHYTESSREHLWSLLGMSVLEARQGGLSTQDQRNATPGSHPG